VALKEKSPRDQPARTPAWPEPMVARTAAYFWPQPEAGLSSDQRAS
jgi:hypothetical protein